MIKSSILDALDESNTNPVVPVSIVGEDSRRLGFLIEEKDDYCTVFLSDIPEGDTGELRIVPAGLVQKLNIRNTALRHTLRNFGKGAIELTNFK